MAADTTSETRSCAQDGSGDRTVRELTEPAPYGPDGDEDDGCDVDLEEKLMRCVYHGSKYPSGIDDDICSLLYMYVSAHHGTFDDSEKNSLRTFLDARRTAPGESELGLGTDELREIRNALA